MDFSALFKHYFTTKRMIIIKILFGVNFKSNNTLVELEQILFWQSVIMNNFTNIFYKLFFDVHMLFYIKKYFQRFTGSVNCVHVFEIG